MRRFVMVLVLAAFIAVVSAPSASAAPRFKLQFGSPAVLFAGVGVQVPYTVQCSEPLALGAVDMTLIQGATRGRGVNEGARCGGDQVVFVFFENWTGGNFVAGRAIATGTVGTIDGDVDRATRGIAIVVPS